MNNPWFRFYNDTLNDPKVQNLSDFLFKVWVNLLCLASKNDGMLPAIEDISFALRLPVAKTKKAVAELIEKHLIDNNDSKLSPHNWEERQFKSDVSTERVKRFRQRSKGVTGNGNETPAETAPEQSRTETDSETDSETEGENVSSDSPNLGTERIPIPATPPARWIDEAMKEKNWERPLTQAHWNKFREYYSDKTKTHAEWNIVWVKWWSREKASEKPLKTARGGVIQA